MVYLTPLIPSVNETQLPKNAIKLNNPAQPNGSGSLEECSWGNYARGALYALQKSGNHIKRVYIFLFVSIQWIQNFEI